MSELFSYESVDETTAETLACFADRGHKLVQTHQIRFIAEMGQLLSEARDSLADHYRGSFITWATTEFDVSKKTIYNYVNAWDRLLCNGYQKYRHLSPTAIYLLINDDTPTQVRKRVQQLAADQSQVRKPDIQKLISGVKANLSCVTVTQHAKNPEENDTLTSQDDPESVIDAKLRSAKTKHDDDDEREQSPPDLPADSAGPDPELVRKQLQSTCEMIRRQFHDLNELAPSDHLDDADHACCQLITFAKDWMK